MATSTPLSYAEDPTLFLYTSLTAGSSHIITATSRLETILKANKIPFRAIDTATDEKARMIWSRRSRGRKLPGLVKHAQVIGDLEQIEEWNEYGELKEQIEDPDEAPPSKASAPVPSLPVPAPAQASTPSSRESSQGRHISISEPPKSADRSQASTLGQAESPMAMAMRQAGAEAAAKAGQKKTLKPMPAAPDPTEKDTTAPVVVEPKIASPMLDPSADPEMTQAKAPAQLAAEGAKRTSVDKIAENETETAASDTSGVVGSSSDKPASNEQQVAEMRRASSISKAPSRLAQTQTHDAPEEAAEVQHSPKFDERPRTHRGSSLSLASAEEIREVEKRNSIEEEPEEDAEEVVADTPALEAKTETEKTEAVEAEAEETKVKKTVAPGVAATHEGEAPASEEPETQKMDAKDAESTGVSVGD